MYFTEANIKFIFSKIRRMVACVILYLYIIRFSRHCYPISCCYLGRLKHEQTWTKLLSVTVLDILVNSSTQVLSSFLSSSIVTRTNKSHLLIKSRSSFEIYRDERTRPTKEPSIGI